MTYSMEHSLALNERFRELDESPWWSGELDSILLPKHVARNAQKDNFGEDCLLVLNSKVVVVWK